MKLKFGIDDGNAQHQNIEQTNRALFQGIFGKLSTFPREIFQNSKDSIETARNQHFGTSGTFRFRRVRLDITILPIHEMIEVFEYAIQTLQERTRLEQLKNSSFKALNGDITELKKSIKVLERGKTDAIIMEDDGTGLDGNSRFQITKGTETILNKNSTSKSSSATGSYGIGKQTAFSISDIFGVLYLNQRYDSRSIIGQIRICSFQKDGNNHSPECYIGKTTKGTSCDWMPLEESDPYFKLRSIEDDGLTTIVPTNQLQDDELWIDKVIHTYIESYSLLLLNKEYTIEIAGSKDVLSKETIRNYIPRISKILLDDNDTEGDYIDRLILTTSVISSEPVKVINLPLKIRKLNKKGDVKISFYKNSEEIPGANGYAFRFFRNGMMIRNWHIPKRGKNKDYCGTVEFEGEDNDWREIFRELETPDHDSLDLKQADILNSQEASFPDQKMFKANFLTPINTAIIQEVEALEGLRYSTDRISFSLPGGVNDDQESYESDFTKPVFEGFQKPKKGNDSTTVGDKDKDTGSGNPGGVNEGGSDDGGGLGGTSQEEDGPTMGPGDGVRGGKGKGQILPIKSKLMSRDDLTHHYKIVIDDFDRSSCDKLEISQYSAADRRTNLLSYKIIRVSVNGEELKSNQWSVSNNSDEQIRSYELQSSNLPESTKLELNLEVQEPRLTTSSFKIIKIKE